MSDLGDYKAITLKAASDLRTLQYHFTRLSGAGLTNQASEANGGLNDLVGVLLNKPNSGQAATIAWLGEVPVIAGGAVTVNAAITTNSAGRAADAASGDIMIGFALQAAGADGEQIRALIGLPQQVTRTP